MGGNVFKLEEKKRLNRKDLQRVSEILESISFSSNYLFVGSCGVDLADDFGDIDVITWDIMTINRLLSKTTFPWKKIGEHSYSFLIDDYIQLDISYHESENFCRNWIKPIKTKTIYDQYKALYRNELLFSSTKYIFPSAILLFQDTKIETFVRHRLTLEDGIFPVVYSYVSDKGNWLKNPRRTIDIKENLMFETFDEYMIKTFGFNQEFSTFDNICDSLINNYQDAFIPIMQDAMRGLMRKNVEMPEIFTEIFSKKPEFSSVSIKPYDGVIGDNFAYELETIKLPKV